jgi:hypothetical protein
MRHCHSLGVELVQSHSELGRETPQYRFGHWLHRWLPEEDEREWIFCAPGPLPS